MPTVIILKVVINHCFGGFGLSRQAVLRMRELGHEGAKTVSLDDCYFSDLCRHDPILVQVVEELGKAANGRNSDLHIEEIELGYGISDHDGMERLLQW